MNIAITLLFLALFAMNAWFIRCGLRRAHGNGYLEGLRDAQPQKRVEVELTEGL